VHLLQLAQKIFVLRHFDKPRLPRQLEHADGIVVGAVPEFRIEMAEKAARGRLPGPPEIEDHFAQRLERRRQRGDHIIRVVGRHGAAG
jgi:hypothetical protein